MTQPTTMVIQNLAIIGGEWTPFSTYRCSKMGGWESPEAGQRALLPRGYNRKPYLNGVEDSTANDNGVRQRIWFE